MVPANAVIIEFDSHLDLEAAITLTARGSEGARSTGSPCRMAIEKREERKSDLAAWRRSKISPFCFVSLSCLVMGRRIGTWGKLAGV